jgi:hypothetical protein
MIFYLLITVLLLTAGLILGQGLVFENESIAYVSDGFGILSSVITIVALVYAYKTYKVWRIPILVEHINSLSMLMYERELAFSNLSSSILVHSEGSTVSKLAIFTIVTNFISIERAMWLRGNYMVANIVASVPEASSLENFWVEYQLYQTNPELECSMFNAEDILKSIYNKQAELNAKILIHHYSLSDLSLGKGWNIEENVKKLL